MFQQFFATSDLLVLPLIAMLLFVAVFTIVLLKVAFGMRDREHLGRMARMPLDEAAVALAPATTGAGPPPDRSPATPRDATDETGHSEETSPYHRHP